MILILLCLITLSCFTTINAEWQFSTLNISASCEAALQRLSMLEETDPQLMAYYWDSWGKPSSGILTGHTTFLGYYDECINLKNTAVGETRYCIYSMEMETTALLNQVVDHSDGVCHSSECPSPFNASSTMDINLGVCYPAQCTPNEFAAVLSAMDVINIATVVDSPFNNNTNTFTIKLKSTRDSPAFCPIIDAEIDTGTIAVIAICGVLAGLVIIGTAVDVLLGLFSSSDLSSEVINDKIKTHTSIDADVVSGNRNNRGPQHNQSIVLNALLAFSLYNTVPKLVSTEQSPLTIKGLSAVRIILNLLIVQVHVFVCAYFYFSLVGQNTGYIRELFSSLIMQPTINATFSVDAFFLLSGTLSAYLTFKDMDKHKRFRWLYFYLNRFFRISPMHYLFTFIAYKLFVHFGSGPVWYTPDYYVCPHTWRYNMVYLTNIVFPSCFTTTWQTSVDMQLFLISPVFILLLYRSRRMGLIVIALAMIAATAKVGFVAARSGLLAAMGVNPNIAEMLKYTEKLHQRIYYRANPYLTGILLGYILYKRYDISVLPIKNWLKWLIYLVLWSIAIYFCTALSLFGTYGEYTGTHHFTDFENVAFLMYSGLALSIGLSIIVYICNTGYGGMISSFLCWPGWDPFARLTFGVYMVHFLVIFYIFGTLQSGLKYTSPVIAMIAVFTLVLSYGISAVAALCMELPIATIVSLCFKMAGMEPRSNNRRV